MRTLDGNRLTIGLLGIIKPSFELILRIEILNNNLFTEQERRYNNYLKKYSKITEKKYKL